MPDINLAIRATMSLHMPGAVVSVFLFWSGSTSSGRRLKTEQERSLVPIGIYGEFRVRSLSLVVLLLFLALRSSRLGSGRNIGLARHRNIANSNVSEENGVVDSNGDKDPRGILLLKEDVRVDQDQDQSDTNEASDVAKHLSFALPGQLQVQ